MLDIFVLGEKSKLLIRFANFDEKSDRYSMLRSSLSSSSSEEGSSSSYCSDLLPEKFFNLALSFMILLAAAFRLSPARAPLPRPLGPRSYL